MNLRPPLLLLLLLPGCSSDLRDYMPLEQGNEWEYVVKWDGDESTEKVRVARSAPVGRLDGWQLEGGMGSCRLAWDGDTLVAAQLADTQYSPPIPLLAPRDRTWSGVVSTPSLRAAGKATLERSSETLTLAGTDHKTAKTVLTLECSGETVQLTTWFFPQMGILRQEQRRGPLLSRDRYIEFVKGP